MYDLCQYICIYVQVRRRLWQNVNLRDATIQIATNQSFTTDQSHSLRENSVPMKDLLQHADLLGSGNANATAAVESDTSTAQAV